MINFVFLSWHLDTTAVLLTWGKFILEPMKNKRLIFLVLQTSMFPFSHRNKLALTFTQSRSTEHCSSTRIQAELVPGVSQGEERERERSGLDVLAQ